MIIHCTLIGVFHILKASILSLQLKLQLFQVFLSFEVRINILQFPSLHLIQELF